MRERRCSVIEVNKVEGDGSDGVPRKIREVVQYQLLNSLPSRWYHYLDNIIKETLDAKKWVYNRCQIPNHGNGRNPLSVLPVPKLARSSNPKTNSNLTPLLYRTKYILINSTLSRWWFFSPSSRFYMTSGINRLIRYLLPASSTKIQFRQNWIRNYVYINLTERHLLSPFSNAHSVPDPFNPIKHPPRPQTQTQS